MGAQGSDLRETLEGDGAPGISMNPEGLVEDYWVG